MRPRPPASHLEGRQCCHDHCRRRLAVPVTPGGGTGRKRNLVVPALCILFAAPLPPHGVCSWRGVQGAAAPWSQRSAGTVERHPSPAAGPSLTLPLGSPVPSSANTLLPLACRLGERCCSHPSAPATHAHAHSRIGTWSGGSARQRGLGGGAPATHAKHASLLAPLRLAPNSSQIATPLPRNAAGRLAWYFCNC